jgi:benzoyl-CoA reductase/2-hydroxyglutaryl-CoA dehydratase subunit BcrC/BadD/HgdB
MNIDEVITQRDYLDYTKQVHSYSNAIGRLVELSHSYITDAEEAHKQGKSAIWANGFWETPLLYACGVVPVSFAEMGRLSDKEAMEIAENYYQFPVETCSMVKCVVGQWHRRRGTSIKKILGSSGACEPFNLAWEIMKKEGYEVYNIDVTYRAPGTEGKRLDQLIDFFKNELYGVVEWLTGSREIDEVRLQTEIRRKNRLIHKVKRILELRLSHPFYLKSLPTILLLNIGLTNYFGKPEEFEEVVDELLAELESRPVDQQELDRVIPLVWAGGTGQEFGIYEAIDQAGGSLLGLRTVPIKPYREDVSPVEALVRYLYDNQNGGAAVYSRQIIENEVAKVNARGLVLYGYIGCSFASVDREMWRNYFHQKGIPSINLEGSYQTGAPTGQLMTRVKAFIEMLS